MRIAVGGVTHETNTYAVASTGPTGLDRFHRLAGDDIADFFAGTGTAIGGILDGCQRGNHEMVPTFYAVAEPSGTITAEAYEQLKGALIDALRTALPVDAVALELHGAGVAHGVDDLEADLGRAIRDVVGPDVPVAAVLDLHGNVTPAMAEAYDLLLGCHLYPHTDLDDRGREVITLLEEVHAGRLRPVIHVEQLPILLPTSTTDGHSPAARANGICAALESRTGVVDCTLMHGFPFTDIPDVGTSIISIAHDDAELARHVAVSAGTWVWDHREDFRAENETPELAVRRAVAVVGKGDRTGPVVINECSDNPGGGTPGDGTHLLRAMVVAAPVGELLAFARLHLEGGVAADGTQVLSAQSVRAMQEEQVVLPDPYTLGRAWGLGWILYDWADLRPEAPPIPLDAVDDTTFVGFVPEAGVSLPVVFFDFDDAGRPGWVHMGARATRRVS